MLKKPGANLPLLPAGVPLPPPARPPRQLRFDIPASPDAEPQPAPLPASRAASPVKVAASRSPSPVKTPQNATRPVMSFETAANMQELSAGAFGLQIPNASGVILIHLLDSFPGDLACPADIGPTPPPRSPPAHLYGRPQRPAPAPHRLWARRRSASAQQRHWSGGALNPPPDTCLCSEHRGFYASCRPHVGLEHARCNAFVGGDQSSGILVLAVHNLSSCRC